MASNNPVDRGSKGDVRQRRALQKLSLESFGATIVAGDGITYDTVTGILSINLGPNSGLEFSSGILQVKVDIIAGNMLQLTANGLKVISPLTTKGDIFVYSTDNARLPVGSDGAVLIADSSQATGLRWDARLIPTVTVHTFSALIDAVNIATANTDGGVQFILKAGDRPLRVKRISITGSIRPNTAAGFASTQGYTWALCRGQGILSVPEAGNTEVPVLPQCLENRRVASSALLVRRAVVDLFNPSGLTMYVQDVRGFLGLVPEPTGGSSLTRTHQYQVDMGLLEADDPDDYVVIIQPGEALVIQTKLLFNGGAGQNPNGYIIWEEDETTLQQL